VQSSGAHDCVPGTEQLPVPEQKAAGWKLVAVLQNAPWHIVVLGAFWQAPAVQSPVFPQGGEAAQRPRGSAVPLVTFVQVPLPERLQTWQVPQAEAVQQTPSVQLADVHS
jgi:hypothetical protein